MTADSKTFTVLRADLRKRLCPIFLLLAAPDGDESRIDGIDKPKIKEPGKMPGFSGQDRENNSGTFCVPIATGNSVHARVPHLKMSPFKEALAIDANRRARRHQESH